MVGNFAIWSGVVRLFGYPTWMALSVAVGLTQIGEFSYVVVQTGRGAGIVGSDVYNATLAASLITILLNTALIRYVRPWLAQRHIHRLATQSRADSEGPSLRNHVLRCGFGRVGSRIGSALQAFHLPFIVIEIDPDLVSLLRSEGTPSVFGNAAHTEILQRAAVETASLVIITIPDPNRSRMTIVNVRRVRPDIPILARAHHQSDKEVLTEAGATEIIQPETEASATFIRHAAAYLRLSDEQIRTYLRTFHKGADRH